MTEEKSYMIEEITEEELEILERNLRKRKTGFYAEIEKQLEKSGLVKITVDRRTVAGGLWNYFSKQKGYVVKQIKKSDSEIIVIIATPERWEEIQKKKQVKKQ
jgi:hypothetical protein